MKYDIYTDGGCRGNGKEINSGGWGVVVMVQTLDAGAFIIDTLSGSEENTTNNRTEMLALITAMEYAVKRHELDNDSCFIIYSDSAYCVNLYNIWIDT